MRDEDFLALKAAKKAAKRAAAEAAGKEPTSTYQVAPLNLIEASIQENQNLKQS